jgi:hypothetical protein
MKHASAKLWKLSLTLSFRLLRHSSMRVASGMPERLHAS